MLYLLEFDAMGSLYSGDRQNLTLGMNWSSTKNAAKSPTNFGTPRVCACSNVRVQRDKLQVNILEDMISCIEAIAKLKALQDRK